MVDTIKFSQMTDGGDIDNDKKTPGLKAGDNVLFNNPWTFLPPGTTAQRPTPSADMYFRLRFNTDLQEYEFYDSILGAWTQLQDSAFTAGPFITYTADPSLPDAQNLGALANGILKQTIALGVATLDIAVNAIDYWAPGDALTRTQAPVAGDDVTNKTYVDALVGGAVTSVEGTANQVLVNATSGTPETGALVLTTPQDIAPTSSPTFAGLTMTGDIDMGGFKATNAAEPVDPQDYATKFYVDQNALNGTSVYAASAATLGTVTQAGAGVGATLTNAGVQATFALDGVNPPVGVNVLIKDTAIGMTAANEGIYTVTDVGSGASNWVLTRAITYDTPTQINNTGLIVVQNGSTLDGTLWYNINHIITVDTTNFNYAEFGGQYALKGANADITSMTGLTGVLQAPTSISSSAGEPVFGFLYNASSVSYISAYNSATADGTGGPGLFVTSTDASSAFGINTKNAAVWISDQSNTIGAAIRFYDADDSHYTELKVADVQATTASFTLPAAVPSVNNAMMQSSTGGVLSLSSVPYPSALGWQTYTPTVTLVGGAGNTVPTYTTNTGRWTQIGNTVFVDILLNNTVGGTAGAGTGILNIALPVATSASITTGQFGGGSGTLLNTAAFEFIAIPILTASSSTVTLGYQTAIGTQTIASGNSQTSANERKIALSFFYEI